VCVCVCVYEHTLISKKFNIVYIFIFIHGIATDKSSVCIKTGNCCKPGLHYECFCKCLSKLCTDP